MGGPIYYVANSIMSFNCYIKSPVNPGVGADRDRTNPADITMDLFQRQMEVLFGNVGECGRCISSFIITILFIHNHPHVMNNLLLTEQAILCRVICKMGIMLL
jgi:hypothetical protein